MASFKMGERYQFKQDSRDGPRYGKKGQWCILEENFPEGRAWGSATLENRVEDQHPGVLGTYKQDLVPEVILTKFLLIIQARGAQPSIVVCNSLNEANRDAPQYVALGYKILARKKITLPFSYMNAPELQPNAVPQAIVEPVYDDEDDELELLDEEPIQPNW